MSSQDEQDRLQIVVLLRIFSRADDNEYITSEEIRTAINAFRQLSDNGVEIIHHLFFPIYGFDIREAINVFRQWSDSSVETFNHILFNITYGFGDGVSTRAQRSTNDSVVANLKRVRVEELAVDVDEVCSICLENFEKNEGKEAEELVCLLPCKHAFHDGCIVKWLNLNHFCPLCRFELTAAESL